MAEVPSCQLPVELIHTIIDVLRDMARSPKESRECRDALRACLLSSFSLRKRAMKHLFYHIRLSNKDAGTKCDAHALDMILHPSESSTIGGIAPFIERFVLSFDPYRSVGAWVLEDIFNELTAFLGSKDVVSIIRGLHGRDFGIKELDIHISVRRLPCMRGPIQWTQFSPEFRDALKSLINSPGLDSLHVRYDGENQTGLVSTNLHHRILPENLPATPSISSLLCNTQHPDIKIHTDHMFPIVDLLPRALFQYLTAITVVDYLDRHAAATWDMIVTAAPSLEEMMISSEYSQFDVIELRNFNLGQLSKLKNISFSCRHLGSLSFPNDPTLVNLHHLFDMVVPHSNLERIDLLFRLEETGHIEFDFLAPSGPQWATLDRTLTDNLRYPSLRHLTISINLCVIVWLLPDVDANQIAGMAKDQLARFLPCLSSSPTTSLDIFFGISYDALGKH